MSRSTASGAPMLECLPDDHRAWRLRLLVATLVILSAAVSACSGATGPSGSTAVRPSPSSGLGEIDHPIGASTVILRIDEGGGFVAPSFFVTQAPAFSLYGDGTAIFRDPTTEPPRGTDQVVRSAPFQAVRLSEPEMQALLAFALGPGGLARARADYQLPVADAPTTTFTIVAGGIMRTVRVNGLGVAAEAGPDTAILTSLAGLRAKLMTFGASVGGETPWLPERYRGVLMDASIGGPLGQAIAWPWTSIRPSDFVRPGDPNGAGWPTRVLSPSDLARLGFDQLEGGATGILLAQPGGESPGRPYAFAIRPLLPDEPR